MYVNPIRDSQTEATIVLESTLLTVKFLIGNRTSSRTTRTTTHSHDGVAEFRVADRGAALAASAISKKSTDHHRPHPVYTSPAGVFQHTMKTLSTPLRLLSVILVCLVGITTFSVVVEAKCDNRGEPCEPSGGKCTTALILALDGNLEAANDALFYGKYCGRNNKCFSNQGEDGSTNGEGNLGLGRRGPPPCDAIDEACKEHDACLDHEVQLAGSFEIPLESRCECDVQFLADLVSYYSGLIPTPTPTMLCDEDFYQNFGSLIQLLGNEAPLIAVPFCCELPKYEEETETCQASPEFTAASTFCNALQLFTFCPSD